MKKILFFLLLLSGVAQGQSRLYLRGDSIQMQSGINAELILLNGSRTVTNGILTNIGNGRTKFLPIDSFDVGATLTPVGTGFDIGISGTSNVKRLAATNGLTLDSATSNTVTAKLGGTIVENTTIAAHHYPLIITYDSLTTSHGLKLSSADQTAGETHLLDISTAGSTNGRPIGIKVSAMADATGGAAARNIGIYSEVGNSQLGPVAIYGRAYTSGGVAVGGYYGKSTSTAISSLVGSSVAAAFTSDTAAIAFFGYNGNINDTTGSSNHNAVTIGLKGYATGLRLVRALGGTSYTGPSFGIYSDLGPSAFVDRHDTFVADSMRALLTVGRSTTARPSVRILDGDAPTIVYDGDMWHTGDSLYFRAGNLTYNLTHLVESGAIDLQSVIDNGATFDKENTIEMDGFSLLFNNSGGFTVYDSAATAVSTMAFNQGFDFMTYTGIVGDTVYNFTQDIANGIKLYGTDGTETHFLQVKGNGIFASGLVFNDGAALCNLAIDTATGEIYTTALSSGSGANTALSNLASVAINTALLPGTDNSIALGSGSKTWADAYFGDGAVMDFNNGGYFMTHLPARMQFKSGLGTQSLFVLMSPDGTDSLKLNADNGGGHILDYTGGMTIRRSNSTQLTFAASTLTSAITFVPRTGSTSAGSAPIKYASGTLMTSSEAGAKEYNGDHYITKASNVRMGLGGALYNNATSASVTGSTEENLITYSLPAATLDNDGDCIEIEGSFLVLTVGDKVIIKFGATKVVEWTTGNTGTYAVSGRITRTGATTQQAQFKIIGEDSGVMITTPAETLSGAITIAGAAQGTGVGDATMYNLNVKYYPTN